MKKLSNRLPSLAPWLAGFALMSGPAHAAPFLYSSGDLVLTFRQSGNASDYVVNLGRASVFSALAAGTTFEITNLPAAQLSAAFPSLDGVSWAVSGAVRLSADPSFPLETIWVTGSRTDPATQSAPWLRKGQFVQGNAASQIDALGNQAAAASSSQPAGTNNTTTGVVIPVDSGYTISPILGETGNLANTFQGSVENVTTDDFVEQSSTSSRSDLYELLPGTSADGTLNANGRYLGYFELKGDGSLVFSNSAPAPARPTLASIQQQGQATTITFVSANGASYRLRSTDASGLGSPLSNWSVGPTVVGNGSVVSLQSTNRTDNQFFVIELQP